MLPAGPPPTIKTSYSIYSLSIYSSYGCSKEVEKERIEVNKEFLFRYFFDKYFVWAL